ncbi:hypothetical protein MPTK1_1g01410 [Marchantia polymorpha subsp. ruderalis]|uniref:Choline transporter-like protein n=2 Tax=Marchantia polymorpha TaxID=3197 RepID=A0A176WA35_MARPO|nr:hypothetical protein AXG93_2960s1450 [Marchantia polymorpha subsp. ruderalis]PTQ42585.1 hypothetical protein MARPO_0029s0105 [Marchantia polymorpha]PTQ42586.1 hypothetical protein MARPO_0029s0105 [Marchantia polymorpha]BBM96897.1 hypothetical protein Mp_1g01410 [Marchantia polymorpha subsp. ruderalis]BBM96898.1 hypothetical protein Mp_1g01410 [Marchantia polymorpha subsp. ruderalis]|eukprot:PTQ42585.1 hypothetical protein MARPO_0029s0105 [Marchantia polymorpha]
MGAELTPSGSEDKVSEQQRPLLEKSGYQGDTSSDTIVNVGNYKGSRVFGYNYNNRPCRDIPFTVVFLIFVVASLAVGIVAAVYSNPDYQWIENTKYRRGCALPNVTDTASFSSASEDLSARHDSQVLWRLIHPLHQTALRGEDPLVKPAFYVFVTTLVLGLPVAYFILWLLRTYTEELVYITLPFIALIPLGISVATFVLCLRNEQCKEQFSLTFQLLCLAVIILMCAVFVWTIYASWDRVDLTIRIVRTAAVALHKNLGLVLVLPGLGVALLFYLVPAVIFMFYAYKNGKIVPNPELERHPNCGPTSVDCCIWKQDSWVPVYLTLTTFAVLWSIMVISEAQVFTISGTVAQWYFADPTASLVGAKRRSLRIAFGPSFGTVCFSGLIVALVRMIRSMIDNSRSQNSSEGCMAAFFRACSQCLLSAVEYLTKFTTNYAAITGAGFCASALMTYDLLRRNFLSTIVVETIAGRLLSQTAFVISAIYGLLVYGVLSIFVDGGKAMWAVSLFAFILLFLVLFFFMQVLNNIVDTVYICYAMDKDHNLVSKTEVHDVLVLLPPAKGVPATLGVPS